GAEAGGAGAALGHADGGEARPEGATGEGAGAGQRRSRDAARERRARERARGSGHGDVAGPVEADAVDRPRGLERGRRPGVPGDVADDGAQEVSDAARVDVEEGARPGVVLHSEDVG